MQQADRNSIVFCNADLEQPFISHDETMWEYLKPELSRCLAELEIDASMSAKVRSVLVKILAGGACAIEDVTEKLGISKRTLQRKLNEENTTFQKQLNSTRKMLAMHYIRNIELTTNDIAYLLGYAEVNSFLRSFIVWTGMTVNEYKKQGQGKDSKVKKKAKSETAFGLE